jgi:hypothetical protein
MRDSLPEAPLGFRSILLQICFVNQAFLDAIDFTNPERLGERGPKFKYPKWLIMCNANLSVKLIINLYLKEDGSHLLQLPIFHSPFPGQFV